MAASLGWSSSVSWTHSIGGGRSVPMVKFPSSTTGTTSRRGTLPIVCDKKVKKFHQIILKEDLETLGKKGDLVRVRVGYFRNYLLPLGKAQLVTPLLLKEMKLEEERINAEKQRVKDVAEQVARALEAVGAFKLKRKGGGGKRIFGRVTSQDLVDVIKAQLQRDVDKRIVTLPDIREIGEYIAEIKLHPEVIARVKVRKRSILSRDIYAYHMMAEEKVLVVFDAILPRDKFKEAC